MALLIPGKILLKLAQGLLGIILQLDARVSAYKQ